MRGQSAVKDLGSLTVGELSILSVQGLKCDHVRCDYYEVYHQCHDYSHVLCPEYLKIIRELKEN